MNFMLITDVDQAALESWGAWGQYYEYRDIDLLCTHGYDRQTVQEAIEAVCFSPNYWFPIPEGTPLGTFKYEYRRAIFRTPRGIELKGYVIGLGHAIRLFGRDEEWGINENLLHHFAEKRERALKDLSLDSDEEIFPLEYEINDRIQCFPRIKDEQVVDLNT